MAPPLPHALEVSARWLMRPTFPEDGSILESNREDGHRVDSDRVDSDREVVRQQIRQKADMALLVGLRPSPFQRENLRGRRIVARQPLWAGSRENRGRVWLAVKSPWLFIA